MTRRAKPEPAAFRAIGSLIAAVKDLRSVLPSVREHIERNQQEGGK